MKLCIALLATGMLFLLPCKGQPLAAGDHLGPIELQNVFNYESPSLKLTDIHKKLIIFDFWDVTCLSCLKSFPELDNLQKEFGDALQIILVNKQTKDSTERFFAKRKKIKLPNVPFVTADSLLHKLFPHEGVPFCVWVDSSYTVRSQTRGYAITATHIANFLKGQDLNAQPYRKTEYKQNLFDTNYQSALHYFSYFSNCQPGVRFSPYRDTGTYQQIRIDCSSIEELYQKAYAGGSETKFNTPGRTIFETGDSAIYHRPRDRNQYDLWLRTHAYNYQLYLPKSRKENKFLVLQEDLRRSFNLIAKIEKRSVRCLLLVRTSRQDKLKSNGGQAANKFYKSGLKSSYVDSIRYVRNVPFGDFLTRFSIYSESNFLLPFVNTTGYTGNIDLTMPGKLVDDANLTDVRKELQKYDLDLVEGDYLIDVLVLNKAGY